MAHRDWFQDADTDDEHPVTRQVQERLGESGEYRAVHAEALELIDALTAGLKGDGRRLWIRTEAAINRRWEEVAAAYYNVGVDAGIAMSADASDRAGTPAAALRRLAAAINAVADRLNE